MAAKNITYLPRKQGERRVKLPFILLNFMASQDFDINELAAYMHLTPQQVSRMADRGKLPGRRVGGSWRFPRAEIHHWLEEQIGVSGEQELEKMESVLDRHQFGEPSISISDLLPLEGIAMPLKARTRGSVISGMSQLAMNTGMLWDPDKMEEAVRERENLHSTALDNGVALLHPRRPLPSIMADAFIVVGRTLQGVPFGGERGGLTNVFFLLGSLDDRGHLRTLARLSRLLSDPDFLPGLRQAEDAVGIRDWIRQRESELFGE